MNRTRTAQGQARHNVMRWFRYHTPDYRQRVLDTARARRAAFNAEREARLNRILTSYLEFLRTEASA